MFFVVGAPRCGTTAICNALRDHPDICFAVPKEPHYFSRLPAGWTPQQLEKDYFPLFFRHGDGRDALYGEGSPSYIYVDPALDAIEQHIPGARYIVMVRNPMEQLPSYHQRLVYLLDENEPDLTKAWRLQAERIQGRSIPNRCRNIYLLRYREICSVAEHIDNLVRKVGADRVKVVLFDDFSRDALGVYRDVLSFLGLPDDGRIKLAKRNRTRIPKRVLLHLALVQPRSELLRLVLARLRQIARKSPLATAFMRKIRRGSSSLAQRAVIPPELWDECAEAFRPSVERLSQIFGRDLSHWLERTPKQVRPSPPTALAAE